MNNMPDNRKLSLRAPSARATAALAAAMLAVGVAVGAAIGPAPSPSQADPSLPVLLQTLAQERRRAGRRGSEPARRRCTAGGHRGSDAEAQTPPAARSRAASEEATSARRARRPRKPGQTTTSSPPSSTTPKSTPKANTLAPVTHVWLIELSGTSFEPASAKATAAPYIDTQAVPAGTLLGGWSGARRQRLRHEAALLAAAGPQLVDTIVQPPCPEGAAGTPCAPETPGALTAADEF